jgi:hypothetical protein
MSDTALASKSKAEDADSRRETTRETVIARYADEDVWTIDTSDPAIVTRLETLGYRPIEDASAAPYYRYQIPEAAVSFRSKGTLRSFANRAEKLRAAGIVPARRGQESRAAHPTGNPIADGPEAI